jgi:hypothetical protein
MPGLGRLIRRYERKRRFWRNVRAEGPQDCWPWLGPTDHDGFGRFEGRPAHERAYELAGGRLPSGAALEHRCGNRHCVNPYHLEPRKPLTDPLR